MAKVTLTISGPAGSGKTAVAQQVSLFLAQAGFRVDDSRVWCDQPVRSFHQHADICKKLMLQNFEVEIVEEHS